MNGGSAEPTKAKEAGKDEHDVNKLLAMIERCGVVITEVQSSECGIYNGRFSRA